MIESYVIYGFSEPSVEELLPAIEAALGITFVLHESLYRGLYYLSGRQGRENYLLQPNYLAARSEVVDAKHPDCPVLLYVNKTKQPDEVSRLLKQRIPSARQLEREDFGS